MTDDAVRENTDNSDVLEQKVRFSPKDLLDDDAPKTLVGDDSWKEGYPYDQKLARRPYEKQKLKLQMELLKLQSHFRDTGEKMILIFEGRDAAGKGGTIKRFTEHLNPRSARIVALEKPSDRELTQWYFQRYVTHFPAAGEMVFMDRSWYNRAGVERVMGYCTPDQYLEFMRQVPELERMIVDSGIHFFKFWFSVGEKEQRRRFFERRTDPLKRWKLSPTDLASLDKWDAYTEAKEAMFFYTDTAHAPWTVVKSNDKKRARIEAMKWVLNTFDYPDKDRKLIGTPDKLIIGSPDVVYEQGERPKKDFPRFMVSGKVPSE
jgi:polyphosphate kinase 2